MAGIVVNGEPRDLHGVPLHTNALDFLRGCGLTGAKEGCAEGECGACSVHGRPPGARRLRGHRVDRDQLLPGPGRGARRPGGRHRRGAPERQRRSDLHPVQHEMAVRGGSQCGYCTPGFVCSHGRGVLPRRAGGDQRHGPGRPRPRLPRRERLRPARDQRQPVPLHRLPADQGRRLRARLPGRGRRARGPSYGARPGARGRPGSTTARPASSGRPPSPRRSGCSDDHEDAVVVAGSTDWGVEVNLRGRRAGLVVAVDRLAELRGFVGDRREVRIGAGAHADRGRAPPRRPAAAGSAADAAVRLAADPQRRHPRRQPRHRLADRRRPAGAARARRVRGAGLDRGGARPLPLADYFTGYRESVRRPGELITEVVVPLPAGRADRVPQDRQAAPSTTSPSVAVGFAVDVADGRVAQGADRARRRGRDADPGAGHRGRARGAAVDARRRSTPPPRCSAARARRSPTSGPAPTTARRCWASRCASCSRRRRDDHPHRQCRNFDP